MEDSYSVFFLKNIISTIVWKKTLCLMVHAHILKTVVPVTDKITDF